MFPLPFRTALEETLRTASPLATTDNIEPSKVKLGSTVASSASLYVKTPLAALPSKDIPLKEMGQTMQANYTSLLQLVVQIPRE